jgi:hypothetical protein
LVDDKTSAKVGIHKLSAEAGMFVKAKVNGVLANLLIDTGATVAIVNTKLYRQMSNVSLCSSERKKYYCQWRVFTSASADNLCMPTLADVLSSSLTKGYDSGPPSLHPWQI